MVEATKSQVNIREIGDMLTQEQRAALKPLIDLGSERPQVDIADVFELSTTLVEFLRARQEDFAVDSQEYQEIEETITAIEQGVEAVFAGV